MWTKLLEIFVFSFLLSRCQSYHLNSNNFPDDFKLGIASAAYQIEGAWNIDGKGENIWDRFTHAHPEKIEDRSNGDIACDAYHHTAEDVALLKDMGVQFYRFSLSWSRILPTGFSNYVNPKGIRYYNELINELIANGIEPMVTLYHWDLPQSLQEIGGFANPLIVEHFENYARVAFENFGDRVKMWITFNEPKMVCRYAYGASFFAPGYENSTGLADYLCGHYLLLAHAKTYHMYDKDFRETQRGKIGITIDMDWYYPHSKSLEDIAATKRLAEFEMGWFANPIFTTEGDYPKILKDRVSLRSKMEGFAKSRLPEFTQQEKNQLIGSSDFFGLNHYTSNVVKDTAEASASNFSYLNDVRIEKYQRSEWTTSGSHWLKVVPDGFRNILKYIKDTYNDPEIYVTENGYSNFQNVTTEDTERSEYLKLYLSALLDAVHTDGVKVKAYTFWTFMDDFEWYFGYNSKFGLYHVDFKDPNRKRTPKDSVKTYQQIIKERSLNNVCSSTSNMNVNYCNGA